MIACRSGADDAPILARQIGLQSPNAILDLANFAAWARLLRHGSPTSPLRLDLYGAPRPLRSSTHRFVATSCMRFGRPREEIEDRITRFLDA
jgi:hypothetical protein